MIGWYVLTVRPQSERQVERGLGEAGIACYLPRQTRLARRKGRATGACIKSPLLPGYVFVQIDTDRQIRPVMEIDGSIDFLHGASASPVAISAAFIAELRQAEDDGAFDSSPRRAEWRKAQKVKIEAGPFQGFFATIAELRPNDRAILIGKFFAGVGRMEIDLSQVVAA